eukprot:scaffold142389_cov18-Tisochrysis_lutea.AAC.1
MQCHRFCSTMRLCSLVTSDVVTGSNLRQKLTVVFSSARMLHSPSVQGALCVQPLGTKKLTQCGIRNHAAVQEDVQEYPEPRMFWPREIWGQYTAKLEDLKETNMRTQAVQCLNHMDYVNSMTCNTCSVPSKPKITALLSQSSPLIALKVLDALQHMPHSIEYMQRLQNTQVFRFCAIPQIMAAGTLALCYDNGKVFEGDGRAKAVCVSMCAPGLLSLNLHAVQRERWMCMLISRLPPA